MVQSQAVPEEKVETRRRRADVPRKPGPLSGGPSALPERSGRRRTWFRRTLQRLAAPTLQAAARLLWATYRVQPVLGAENARLLREPERPVILSFWHENAFACPYFLQRFPERKAELTYMVSPSVDGDLFTRVLESAGGRVIRGSATRSGVKSLKHFYRAMAKDKISPVIVPDGPVGPPRECKPGAIMLSQLSGAPILPITCAAERVWRLNTWDRLIVPRPFTRLVIAVGKPWTVPADLAGSDLERESETMQRTLLELGETARSALGS